MRALKAYTQLLSRKLFVLLCFFMKRSSSVENRVVYKFLPPADYALKFFDDGKLRVSQLMALNDPFECLSYFVRADAQQIAKQMVENGQHKELCLRLAQPHFAILNGKMPHVAMEAGRAFLNTKIGILSLSEDWSSSKMWGYYAGKHAGFCIGFDANHPFWAGITDSIEYGRLRRVTYSSKRAVCDLTKKEAPSDDVFFTKSTDWEHEKEVRAIYELKDEDAADYDDVAERVYCKAIPHEAVKEIIVGCNTSAGTMRVCLQFGKKHAIPVYLCQPQLENETFAMTRFEIDKMPFGAAEA